MAKIKVRWEVADGYAGKSRPQYTTINTEDFDDWEEMSEGEKKGHIEEMVQEDFEQKISFCIEDYGLNND